MSPAFGAANVGIDILFTDSTAELENTIRGAIDPGTTVDAPFALNLGTEALKRSSKSLNVLCPLRRRYSRSFRRLYTSDTIYRGSRLYIDLTRDTVWPRYRQNRSKSTKYLN